MNKPWLEVDIPGIRSVKDFENFVDKGCIIGEGGHKIEEVNHMLLHVAMMDVELVKLQNLHTLRVRFNSNLSRVWGLFEICVVVVEEAVSF